MRHEIVLFGVITLLLAVCGIAQAQPAPMVEQYLTSGKLADGEAAITQHLQANPQDDQARFGLGALQVIRAVEQLVQSFHAYGLKTESEIPFARLPVPQNPNPKVLTYQAAGQIMRSWSEALEKAEKTLAAVKSKEVKLPLHFGLIRLDFDGNGQAGDDETLWKIWAATHQSGATADQAKEFVISFDAGDVPWLRGYCHLLMALSDGILAYDEKALFDSTAHIFFSKVQSPYPFLQQGRKVFDPGMGIDVADAIALVHLIRCPVSDAKRMTSALEHLKTMLTLSRESWKLILAETDNDHEWIPNPKQETVIPGVRVTEEMVSKWHRFLDEADLLLAGKKLAPFWRGDGAKGVNLSRIFTEPKPLDLVLWVQGTAAAPYLEEGQITSSETWQEIWDAFGGQGFFGFAIWFN